MATGTTLNYSLPYPKSTDPVNVASDIQDLATSLDTDLPEIIQDLSSSMITGGTNYGISTSYNDTTGKLSIGVIDDGHSHVAGNIDDLQASLDLKSNIDSPVFTGNPTAPTPSLGDNDSSLATTSFVTSAIDAIESSAVYYQDDAPLSPEVGSVWVDSDEAFSSFSSNDFILKSGGVFTGNIDGTTANFTGNLDGATASFTGSVSAPTAAALTSTTQLATTEFVSRSSVELRQFGAAGSVLQNIPTRVNPAEQLLKYSTFWIDSAHSSAGSQTIQNLGWGDAALNAQNGSTGSADSNDALFLAWTGENYVYLPGVSSNRLTVPDEVSLDVTGDIDIRVYVAADDWTPAARSAALAKSGNAGNFSYRFSLVASTGLLTLTWTVDGTNGITRNSTVAPTVVDGAALWIRVTLDVDNGAAGHDVRFFTSTDNTTWTQLGATVTTAGVTSIFSGTSQIEVGSSINGDLLAGKFYRAQIFNGIDGTKVLDVDTSVITTGSAASFTALTGQTVTINRSTAGRKSVAVVSPVWLFGTDDYMEVPDNDLLDFGASDSFTVLAVVREWSTPPPFARIINKANSADTGWSMLSSSTPFSISVNIDDGPNAASRNGLSTSSAGAVSVKGMLVDRTAQTLQSFNNATLSDTTSTSAVGTLANALPMRVGRDSTGTSYNNMELVAVAVFRRALTAGEIATISTYYQGRLS